MPAPLLAAPTLLRAPPPRLLAKTCPDTHDPAIVSAMLAWHSDRPPPRLHHTVTEDESGARLTRVGGSRFAPLGTKSQAEHAVRRGDLLVNGLAVEKSRRVQQGDVLQLQPPAAARPSEKRLHARARFVEHLRSQGLRVLHEDEAVAVVFKPPGIHTKAGSNAKFAALEDALTAELSPPPRDAPDALPLPLALHRLDVPVSGLCLVAKTRSAAVELGRQFAAREVAKVYHALLVGRPPVDQACGGRLEIRAPLQGQPAASTLEVLSVTPHAQWGHLSWVRMSPLTGRTHQLRLHAAGLGCPIVGDDLYWGHAAAARRSRGGAEALPPVRASGGLFLQSCGVAFAHPDPQRGLVQVMVGEAPKFGALRARARSGAQYHGL